jgi:hypothetical protein
MYDGVKKHHPDQQPKNVTSWQIGTLDFAVSGARLW